MSKTPTVAHYYTPGVLESIDYWIEQGFTEQHKFPGEYVLLINPATMGKVRVYESGDIWLSNRTSGSYVRPAK